MLKSLSNIVCFLAVFPFVQLFAADLTLTSTSGLNNVNQRVYKNKKSNNLIVVIERDVKYSELRNLLENSNSFTCDLGNKRSTQDIKDGFCSTETGLSGWVLDEKCSVTLNDPKFAKTFIYLTTLSSLFFWEYKCQDARRFDVFFDRGCENCSLNGIIIVGTFAIFAAIIYRAIYPSFEDQLRTELLKWTTKYPIVIFANKKQFETITSVLKTHHRFKEKD